LRYVGELRTPRVRLAELLLALTRGVREREMALACPGWPLEVEALGAARWYGSVPAAIGEALRRIGASGAVVYEGMVESLHVYAVYCRPKEGPPALIRLAFSEREKGALLVLASAARL